MQCASDEGLSPRATVRVERTPHPSEFLASGGAALSRKGRGHINSYEPNSRNASSTTLRCSAVSAACGGTGSPTS